METRSNAYIAQQELASFARPLIEELGGVTRANELYFELMGRDDLPDNRKLFRALASGTRRIGARQTFNLGRFLWHHFPWCTPLTMLYAAGHLDRYVLVIATAIENEGVSPNIRRTIVSTSDATWFCELDAIKIPEDPLLARFFRDPPRDVLFGSLFARASSEPNFEGLWNSNGSQMFDRATYREQYFRRDRARLRSFFGADFIQDLIRYEHLLTSETIEPSLPELLIAFKCGQISDLPPELKALAGCGLSRSVHSAEYSRTT